MNETTEDVPHESTEQSKEHMVDENKDLHSGLNENQNKKADDSSIANDGHGNANKNKGKQSYASFFKDNRAPVEASLLRYIAPPSGEIVIEANEIDSVEDTFGFCLVGYVMGNRPGPFAFVNFVKGWGGNIKFAFMDNGWIKFQFANEEDRDRILNGGTYMIMGRRLFLKKMPDCFFFRKEDMESIPTWIQIYGLHKQCWNPQVLSRIASVVGKPIHTDMLTINKKGATYARVIVEIDAKQPRIYEFSVKMPSGISTLVKFKYEFEPKYCDNCKSVGHTTEMCGLDNRRKQYTKRPSNESSKDASSSHEPTKDIPKEAAKNDEYTAGLENVPGSSGIINNETAESAPLSPKLQGPKIDHGKRIIEGNSDEDDGHCRYDSEMGDDFPFDENISNEFHSEEYAFDSDEIEEILSKVETQDKDEWKKVAKKKKKPKTKKHYKMPTKTKITTDGNSSLDTEYVPIDPTTKQPIIGQKSKFFKKSNMEGRPPDTASGCP